MVPTISPGREWLAGQVGAVEVDQLGGVPSSVRLMRTLLGFKSPWTMPRSWRDPQAVSDCLE